MQKAKVRGVSPVDKAHRKLKPPRMGGVRLQAKIQVRARPETCYRFWRDFERLPEFMSHLQTVEVVDHRHSHWVVAAPGDTTAEWDAEIIEDQPSERISWRSAENAQVDNAGSVHFVPRSDGRETEVEVILTYNPPLGPVGEALMAFFGERPEAQLQDDLSHFKEAVEKEG